MDLVAFPANPRSTWKTARTLKDLGELTARWLEGDFDESPSYGGPPDDETTGLVSTLAAVNRAGFLTDQSQPGTPERTSWDGLPYWQRAAVQGFIADVPGAGLFGQLCHLAREAGALPYMVEVGTGDFSRLIVLVRRAPMWRFDYRSALPVTIGPDGVHCSFGPGMPRRHLRWQFGIWCSRSAVDEVCGAWQVTIIDPVWGRNDVLWPMLDEFAGREASSHAADHGPSAA